MCAKQIRAEQECTAFSSDHVNEEVLNASSAKWNGRCVNNMQRRRARANAGIVIYELQITVQAAGTVSVDVSVL